MKLTKIASVVLLCGVSVASHAALLVSDISSSGSSSSFIEASVYVGSGGGASLIRPFSVGDISLRSDAGDMANRAAVYRHTGVNPSHSFSDFFPVAAPLSLGGGLIGDVAGHYNFLQFGLTDFGYQDGVSVSLNFQTNLNTYSISLSEVGTTQTTDYGTTTGLASYHGFGLDGSDEHFTGFSIYTVPENARGFGLSSVAYGNAPAMTQPIPEPETYALMLAGLGVVGFVARRRKNQRQQDTLVA
jgi:hypothetical protein